MLSSSKMSYNKSLNRNEVIIQLLVDSRVVLFNKMRVILFINLLFCYCGAGVASTFEDELVQAAINRTGHNVKYDGAYYSIDYPGGDVPANIGVCTDVLIRSYRRLGVDLQKEVHEDILANFGSYPSKRIWGLSRPDTNIDHRRVPNLQVFFKVPDRGSVNPTPLGGRGGMVSLMPCRMTSTVATRYGIASITWSG